MKRSTVLLIVGLAVTAAASGSEPGNLVGGCRSPITLGSDASALKDAFNKAKGSVRLLFVIDPICPGCLRGANDMNRAVLEKFAPNPKLSTWVVHVPVIGGKEGDVQRSCKVLKEGAVTHYWSPKGEFGGMVSNGVDLKDLKGKWVYAWDVWLLYGPDAEWTGHNPPKPKRLMHQLWALSEGSAFDVFDPERFASEVGDELNLVGVAASAVPPK